MTKLEWKPKGLLISRLKTRSYRSLIKGDVIRKQFYKIRELKEKQRTLIKETKKKERIIKGRVKEVVRLNKKLNNWNQSRQMNKSKQGRTHHSSSEYLKFGDFEPILIETLTSSLESLSIQSQATNVLISQTNSLLAQSHVSTMKESLASQTSSDSIFIPEFFLKSNNEVSPRLEDPEIFFSRQRPSNDLDYYDDVKVQQACQIFKDDLKLGNSKLVVLHTDSDTTYSYYNDEDERCRLVRLDAPLEQLSNSSYDTTKSAQNSIQEISFQQDLVTSSFNTRFGNIKDFDIVEDGEYGISFFYDPCDCTFRTRVMTARFLRTLNLRYKGCDDYLPVKWIDDAHLFKKWKIKDWRNKFKDFALHFDEFDPNTHQELDNPGSEFDSTKEGTEETSHSNLGSVFESED